MLDKLLKLLLQLFDEKNEEVKEEIKNLINQIYYNFTKLPKDYEYEVPKPYCEFHRHIHRQHSQ